MDAITLLKRKILPVLVLAVSFAAPPTCAESRELDEEFSIYVYTPEDPTLPSEKFLKSGRYEKALPLIKFPDSYKSQHAFVQFLISAYLLGRDEDIIRKCGEWLKLNPNASSKSKSLIYEFLGMSYGGLQMFDRSIAAFDEAIKLDPDSQTALKGRKNAVFRRDDQIEKIAGLTRPEELGPFMRMKIGVPFLESPDNWRSIPAAEVAITKARKFENDGQFASATKFYEEAAKIDDKNPGIWTALGLCCISDALTNTDPGTDENKQLKDAEKHLARALQLSKENWRTSSNYAAALYLTDPYSAKTAFEKTLQSDGLPQHQREAIKSAIQALNKQDKVKNVYDHK